MAISGIGQYAYQNNQMAANKNTNGGKEADFGAKINQVSSGRTNRIMLDPDALFSIHHAATGESANVYRAEEYSDTNPLYLVKGIDKNGNEYEETIDVSKVNPNHCSYRELLALNAHTGNKSDSNFLTMSVLKDRADNVSYEEKTDYLSMAYEILEEMKTAGCWDGYMRYDKWIHDLLNINTSKMTVWYHDAPLQEQRSEDTRHTDRETGISWYVGEKGPYMTGEDAEKLRKLCQETGEPWLKKFAEMTGTIQRLDEDTVAYVGDNGTLIVSKDGESLSLDTSAYTYEALMNLFRNLPKDGNYLDRSFWAENMLKMQSSLL